MAVDLGLKIDQQVKVYGKKAVVKQIIKHLSPVAYNPVTGAPPRDEDQIPDHIKSVTVVVRIDGEDEDRRVASTEITVQLLSKIAFKETNMPSTVQVTSMKTGPASTISKTFANVSEITINFNTKMLKVKSNDGTPDCDIDIDGATALTDTITTKQHVIAIS